MKMSDKIDLLATALSKAQTEIIGAKKTSDNPFFKSKYATLEDVWEAVRVPLTNNGLSVSQGGEGKTLSTLLLHSSGQWLMSQMELTPVKQDPQSITSAITYMRRTMLASITGCPQVDDDGNMASQKDMPQAKVKEVVKDYKGPEVKPIRCPVDGNQKFDVGAHTGKTLWDVLKDDSVNDFAYAKARKLDIENGKTIPKVGKDYVMLAEFEGAF